MVTVVTRVRIKDGREAEWDQVFARRVEAARDQQGFEFVQLCQPDSDVRSVAAAVRFGTASLR